MCLPITSAAWPSPLVHHQADVVDCCHWGRTSEISKSNPEGGFSSAYNERERASRCSWKNTESDDTGGRRARKHQNWQNVVKDDQKSKWNIWKWINIIKLFGSLLENGGFLPPSLDHKWRSTRRIDGSVQRQQQQCGTLYWTSWWKTELSIYQSSSDWKNDEFPP